MRKKFLTIIKALLFAGSFFILIRMKIILLCVALLMMPCLADEPAIVTPVDSAAYYQKMYEYNLEKYHTDVFVKDVMFWTYIGGMIASGCISLPVALGAGSRGGKISTMEMVGIIAPLAIMGTAGIGYITFEIATLVRRSKYEKYYQKWENSKNSSNSMQVGIAPLLNPLDGRYGAVLAFSF